jgi:hypothetical protein
MKFFTLLPVLSMLTLSGFAQTGEANVLSPTEQAQGWILLWDGSTASGWSPELVCNWKTTGGVLTAAKGAFFWLRYDTLYADFVLKADFRMLSPEADSGIFIRAAAKGDPSRTGYQININNMNQDYGTGSVVYRVKYNGSPVSPKEWHTYEITAQGDHITAVLDGKNTVDFHDKASATGYIGLQFLKGEDVEFRNIKLLRLGPPQNVR